MKLSNKAARFGWWFSACFLLMCAMFTYILIRDGLSHVQTDSPSAFDHALPWLMPTVLAVFWAAGLGAAWYLMGIPCIEARVDASGCVHILRRYPLRTESQIIHTADLAGAALVETKDSEGDLYYSIRLTTADGMQMDVAQSPDRAICEAALSRFNAALRASAAG